MGTFGGLSPYPRRFGGGKSRVQTILESLNASRGTAYDTTWGSKVYAINLGLARALSAAWGTNVRLGNLWTWDRASIEIVERWERILAFVPLPTETEPDRRGRLVRHFARFGRASFHGALHSRLVDAVGDAFVAIEHISFANALVTVPDGTFPWGSPSIYAPWSSSVAHVLVRLQKPAGYSEAEFYSAAAKAIETLDPILPAWATVDWYRPGPISSAVSGGPSAAGFYLDDDHNLDNEIFDE